MVKVSEWLSHKDDSTLKPGDVINDRWKVQGLIGTTAEPGSECDAPDGGSVYMMPDGNFACRCVVCPRCHHHTGNSHQGHYWAFCSALAARVRAGLAPGETLPPGEFMKRATRDFHFCCPGNCELETAS